MLNDGMTNGWSVASYLPFPGHVMKVLFFLEGGAEDARVRWGVLAACLIAFFLGWVIPDAPDSGSGPSGAGDDDATSTESTTSLFSVLSDVCSSTRGLEKGFVDPANGLSLVRLTHLLTMRAPFIYHACTLHISTLSPCISHCNGN